MCISRMALFIYRMVENIGGIKTLMKSDVSAVSAWFLKIALVCASVCMCVCVSVPEGINNQWRDMV